MPVNWCEELGTVLSNDEVINENVEPSEPDVQEEYDDFDDYEESEEDIDKEIEEGFEKMMEGEEE